VTLQGDVVQVDGNISQWKALYIGPMNRMRVRIQDADTTNVGVLVYPFTAFGNLKRPKSESIVFKNGTVWTNENEGVLKNADVWIKDGKIKAIGHNLSPDGARVVDIKGKHLTPGIIDEHSHIAVTGGINEASQAVTAEVRIGDVINSEDINIY